MASSGKRIQILSTIERQNLYDIPIFNQEERSLYFHLNEEEKTVIESFKSLESKVYFIWQLGYFRAKSLFFMNQISEENPDIQYILKQYFPSVPLPLRSISTRTCFDIQSRILHLFSWQLFNKKEKEQAINKAVELVKICTDPRYIFDGLLDFFNQHQIVIPGYSTLQDIVGNVLTSETKRLTQLLVTHLSPDLATN